MQTLASIIRLVTRRSLGNWRLLLYVAIGVILAATLVSATAIYSDAIRDLGLSYAIRQHDRNKLDVQIQLGSLVTQRHANDVRNAIITNSVHNTVGSYVRSSSQSAHSATFFLSAVGKPYPSNDNRPRAYFQYFSDLQQHAHLVAGKWPATAPPATPKAPPAVQVLLSKQTADRLHVQVGQSFDLHPFWRPPNLPPVRVTVSGLIEPDNLKEEYWLGTPEIFDVTSTTWPTYPFFTDEHTFVDTVAGYLPDMDADYSTKLYLAFDKINGRNAVQVENGLRGLTSYLTQNVEQATVLTDLPDVIQNFRTHLFFTRVPLFALIIQIVGIVLYYIVMVATMLVERQTGEIALLRSRGASMRQIMAVYAVEGGILGLIAILLGPPLAALAVKLLGPTPPFHALSGGAFLTVRLSVQAYGLAALGALLAFLALLWPAYRATKLSIVNYKQTLARPPAQPAFLRYYLDVFLIAIVAFALYELRQNDSLITTRLFGGQSADPLLLATPTLFMLMIALLFLRIFPLVLGAVSWLASKVGGAAVILGLWHMVRSPVHYSRLILLLILATSVAMFAAGFRSTLNRSYQDRASYQAGADLRLTGLNLATTNSPAQDEKLGADATGATAASAVTRIDASYEPAPYRLVSSTLLAVDSKTFGKVAYFRSDFAAQSLAGLLKPLIANRPGPVSGLSLGNASYLGIWMLNPGNATGFAIDARVIDAQGSVWDYRLADTGRQVNGWHFLAQNLSRPAFQGGFGRRIRQPAGPLRLQSLYVDANPVNSPAVQQITLYFDNMQTAAGPTPNPGSQGFANATLIDGFEDVRNLEPIDGLTQDPTTDTFARSADYTFGGRYSGKLVWSRSQSTPLVHGFRIRDDGQPLQVLASDDFLKASGSHVGQTIRLFVGSVYVPAHIEASFQYFPTFTPGGDTHFLVADLSRLSYAYAVTPSEGGSLTPDELWLKGASLSGAATTNGQAPLGAEEVFDRAQLSANQQHDPLVAAGWEGILFLLLSGVLILTALGFLVYSYLSAQSRSLEFAVLRTLGFSPLQIAADVFFEQSFIIGAGLLAGTLLGLPLGGLMIGYMGIDSSGAKVVPPLVSSVSWQTILAVYGILLLVFFCTIVALVALYSRLAISRALRMGEL